MCLLAWGSGSFSVAFVFEAEHTRVLARCCSCEHPEAMSGPNGILSNAAKQDETDFLPEGESEADLIMQLRAEVNNLHQQVRHLHNLNDSNLWEIRRAQQMNDRLLHELDHVKTEAKKGLEQIGVYVKW